MSEFSFNNLIDGDSQGMFGQGTEYQQPMQLAAAAATPYYPTPASAASPASSVDQVQAAVAEPPYDFYDYAGRLAYCSQANAMTLDKKWLEHVPITSDLSADEVARRHAANQMFDQYKAGRRRVRNRASAAKTRGNIRKRLDQLDALRAQHNAVVADRRSLIEQANQRFRDLAGQNEQLRSQARVVQNQSEQLQSQNEELRSQNEQLQGQVDTLEAGQMLSQFTIVQLAQQRDFLLLRCGHVEDLLFVDALMDEQLNRDVGQFLFPRLVRGEEAISEQQQAGGDAEGPGDSETKTEEKSE